MFGRRRENDNFSFKSSKLTVKLTSSVFLSRSESNEKLTDMTNMHVDD